MTELLVALFIIAVLLSLLLPAVQSAREAARRTQCRNNARQLALACLGHEAAHGFLPSNGWGYAWVGEPGRGVGKRQPGGWIFSALPYFERDDLWEMGESDPPFVRFQTLSVRSREPVALAACPSRPEGPLRPANPAVLPHNALFSEFVATTDYAINEGDFISDTRGGPATLAEGDDPAYAWKDTSHVTGVSFLRSEVRPASIRDGLSNTYLLGEKALSGTLADGGYDLGNDQNLLSGVDLDITRWTIEPPCRDGTPMSPPRRFGSSHAGICHMAFCDGSVRAVSFQIDREVHRRLGTRAEGLPAALSD